MVTHKKIALMQITHDLAIGGLQQVVVNLCKNINRNVYDVSVLCLKALGEFTPIIKDLGVKLYFLPQPAKGTDYLSFLKVGRILRKQKIDIIHTHNTQPFIDGTFGAFLSGVKTIIHTDHAREFPDKRRYMLVERMLSHYSYRIVGVSESTVENLIRYEKISPRKTLVIPNGIDLSKFNIPFCRESKMKEIGLRNKGPVIGVVGRLAREKGISVLLKAMPDLIHEYPGITLLIVGNGTQERDLKSECGALKIQKNVIFAGPRIDIPEILEILDVYVLPSLREGLPMILLEAMAAGCPIVASNVGGVPSLIQDGYSGLLFKQGDSAMLANQLIKLLKNETLKSKYSTNSLKLVQEYSVEKMTGKYEELYWSGYWQNSRMNAIVS